MIAVISSVLAFFSGFLFCLLCLAKCSREKWNEVKDVIEKVRKDEEEENDV